MISSTQNHGQLNSAHEFLARRAGELEEARERWFDKIARDGLFGRTTTKECACMLEILDDLLASLKNMIMVLCSDEYGTDATNEASKALGLTSW